MGTNTLTDKIGGNTIVAADINDIHEAIETDLVPRNSSGVPTDLAGSIGTPAFNWQEGRFDSVIISGSDVSSQLLVIRDNDIVSGLTRSVGEQPVFLDPIGTTGGLQFDILGASTNLIYDVVGVRFTLIANLSHTFLGAAPSANNTALINDTDAVDQISTRTWGEFLAEKEVIFIDTAGSEITDLIGTYQAFEIDNGVDTEIILAFIESATFLSKIRRGFFFDSATLPIKRIVFSNNDTITLLALKWVFLNKDLATITTTANNPTWSPTEPVGAVSGDYWYDLTNEIWKAHDGAIFNADDSTLMGFVVADTADCIAVRCEEFGKLFAVDDSIEFLVDSTSLIKSNYLDNIANVNGNELKFKTTVLEWDMATDLAASTDMYLATEQASTRYYLYMDQFGERIISDFEPIYRFEMLGFYHPSNPWRCLGYAFNDSSSDLTFTSWFTPFPQEQEDDIFMSFSTGPVVLSSSTFQVLTLSAPDPTAGSAFQRSGNNLNLTKRGWYDLSIRLGGEKSSSAISAFDIRLRDTTNGVNITSLNPASFKGNNVTPLANGTWFRLFEYFDLTNPTLQFQARRFSGTTTWTVDLIEITLRRYKRLHI